MSQQPVIEPDYAPCAKCNGATERDEHGMWHHDVTDPDYIAWPWFHAPEPDFEDHWN